MAYFFNAPRHIFAKFATKRLRRQSFLRRIRITPAARRMERNTKTQNNFCKKSIAISYTIP